MSLPSDERAVDVTNMDNSIKRWEQALNYYQESCANIRNSRSNEKIRCVAIMDTSYSMDGKRLICVKLGLCSLLANFAADDEMNVIAFASKVISVTGGFKSVSDLIAIAPQFLHSMLTDGCTACYDAIVDGISSMRDRASLCQSFATESSSDVAFKNIAIVLTDGEDNESIHTAKSVERFLVNPQMKTFMFLMVAVDMTKQWERKFRSWMDLSHCKQVRVNVRTGSSLVGVFKEMLLCRILQTASTSVRFLQESVAVDGVSAMGSGTNGLSEDEFLTLRAKLLRQVPTEDIKHPGITGAGARVKASGIAWGGDGDDDEDDIEECDIPCLVRNTSEGVSSICSCSDGGGGRDFDDFEDYYDEDDSSLPSISNMPRRMSLSSSDSSDSSDDSSVGSHDDSADDRHAVVISHLKGDKRPGSAGNENDHLDVYGHTDSDMMMTYPSECYCPISHTIMTDPVICADGHTYEKKHIQSWLAKNMTSPNTNAVLAHRQLVPNHSLRNLIQLLTNQNRSLMPPITPNGHHLPAISEI